MNEVTGKQEVGRNFLDFRMYRIIYPSGGRGDRTQGNGLPCVSVANTLLSCS